MMTRKDFRVVAEELRDEMLTLDEIEHQEEIHEFWRVVNKLERAFSRINPRFNDYIFEEAIKNG